MPHELNYLKETASQTAGPYVHIGLIPKQAGFDIFDHEFSNVMVDGRTKGERIKFEGRIFDGSGALVRDALVEVWQANAAGRYDHPADSQDKPFDPHFRGFGRAGSHFDTGMYFFDTIKPGAVVGRSGHPMAPHLNLWIVARGINIGLNTRAYFSDEVAANTGDPVLNLVELPERRKTLIAQRSVRDGEVVFTFDICLKGERETVFLDV